MTLSSSVCGRQLWASSFTIWDRTGGGRTLLLAPFLPYCKFSRAQSFPLTASRSHCKTRAEASTATPGGGSSQRGGLQLAWWPLASTVAARRSRESSPKDLAACIISWAIPLEFQLHPVCLLARARLYSPIFSFPSGSRGPNAPSFHRQSWGTAQRTCTSSATAWVHTWLGKQAGGWRATWAGSQVGVLRASLGYEGPQGVRETCQCLS